MQSFACRFTVGALLLLAACDKGGGKPMDEYDYDADMPPDGEDAGHDSGPMEDDASADGGVDGDAEVVSGDEHCQGEVFTFDGVRSSGRRLSMLVVGETAHLVYPTPACSGTSARSPAQALSYVSLGQNDALPSEPRQLVNGTSCAVTRDPALYVDGDDLRVYYTSNALGSYDLLSTSVSEGSTPERATDSAGSELDTAVTVIAGTPRAFFSSETVGAADMPAPIYSFSAEGISDTLAASANVRATDLVASQLVDGSSFGMLAFPSSMAGSPGIYLSVVDASGAARGAPTLLSSMLGAGSAIGLANNDDGGAVIYSEVPGGKAHQLRFRTITADGTVGDPVRLTSANQDMNDLALTAFKGGYLAAYRRAAADEGLSASIRLLFVDEVGNVKMTGYVADAGSTQGTTQLGVSSDGDTFFVAWSNVSAVTDEDTGNVSVVEDVSLARFRCATVPKLTCDD